MPLEEQINNISLILSDVDGVLTDGGIIFDNEGIETKRFHIQDGLGIRLWQKAGHRFGLVTGRSSHIVQVRANELDIDIVRQGFEEKLTVVREIINGANLAAEQVCYIGDDLPDLPVFRHVGLSAAVADAASDVRNSAEIVLQRRGGEGAVRELIEAILRSQGRWDKLLRRYTGNEA
jgi:YrbI family 3-deoxy-D-manno-octulosonate 8-phosphate phosphatase